MSLHHEVRFKLKVIGLSQLHNAASAVYTIIRLEYSLERLSPCYFLWFLKLAGLPVSPAHSNGMMRHMFPAYQHFVTLTCCDPY